MPIVGVRPVPPRIHLACLAAIERPVGDAAAGLRALLLEDAPHPVAEIAAP